MPTVENVGDNKFEDGAGIQYEWCPEKKRGIRGAGPQKRHHLRGKGKRICLHAKGKPQKKPDLPTP